MKYKILNTETITSYYLNTECFCKESKKVSIIPVNKKCYKQLISNYRPVSLLPICGNVFEKIFLIWLFDYLNNSNLLCSIQSEFSPDDSYIHQHVLIAHYISKAFDATPLLKVRGAFLDLSKVLATQPAITCSKLTKETLEQGVKYVQS